MTLSGMSDENAARRRSCGEGGVRSGRSSATGAGSGSGSGSRASRQACVARDSVSRRSV
jgi:hypothetical protein